MYKFFQDLLNPLHIYCRLMDLRLGKKLSSILTIIYEKIYRRIRGY